jgi:hypothetical protein
MADEEPIFKETLSPQEMQGWLREEIRDSAKAHELRVKEATEFVTAYASGKISAEEAADRLHQYDKRWGEALYGATASPGVSDEAIVRAIDKARETAFGRHTERFGNRPQGPAKQSL